MSDNRNFIIFEFIENFRNTLENTFVVCRLFGRNAVAFSGSAFDFKVGIVGPEYDRRNGHFKHIAFADDEHVDGDDPPHRRRHAEIVFNGKHPRIIDRRLNAFRHARRGLLRIAQTVPHDAFRNRRRSARLPKAATVRIVDRKRPCGNFAFCRTVQSDKQIVIDAVIIGTEV